MANVSHKHGQWQRILLKATNDKLGNFSSSSNKQKANYYSSKSIDISKRGPEIVKLNISVCCDYVW